MGKFVYVRDKKTKAHEPGWWPQKKKMEAVVTWMTCGNLIQTSQLTGVPHDKIKTWKRQPWWMELVSEIRDDDNQELDAKYARIVKKALVVVEDRLDNGNFQMDQKTGRILRVPVSLGDSHRLMKDLVDQRASVLQNGKAEAEATPETVNDKLVKLASQFAEFALGNKRVEKPVYDAFEELPTSTPQPALKNATEAVLGG